MLTIRSRFLRLNFWSMREERINQENRKTGKQERIFNEIALHFLSSCFPNSIFCFSAIGADEAAHNIRGIAHKSRGAAPGQRLLVVCKAGTMSILPPRRTNILPRCHRCRAIRAARIASRRRTKPQSCHKAVAMFARDFAERLLHPRWSEPSLLARERNRKF